MAELMEDDDGDRRDIEGPSAWAVPSDRDAPSDELVEAIARAIGGTRYATPPSQWWDAGARHGLRREARAAIEAYEKFKGSDTRGEANPKSGGMMTPEQVRENT